MNSRIIPVLVVVGVLGMVTGLAAKSPPKKVVIDTCKSKKSGVSFDHEQHAKKLKIDCKTCHHTGKQQSCSTAKCHAGKAEGKRPGCAEMSMKKNPYHINCAGCHKKQKKGPTKCKACHPK